MDEGPPPRFTLHALDVGTGLSIVVQGEDFTLLYDAGSNDDRKTGLDNRVSAYLALLLGPSAVTGCSRTEGGTEPAHDAPRAIDHLFVSHPHRDHLGLLPDVFRCYDVRSVWMSGKPSRSAAFADFMEAAGAEPGAREHTGQRAQGQVATEFKAGEWIHFGRGARGEVLSVRPFARDDNDASIVLRLELGATSVLLTGDATAGERRHPDEPPDRGSVEATLLVEPPARLQSDVLVVGHHGSKTSTRRAFVRAVRPRYAIVSSGPMPYGEVVLPDPEIVEMLQEERVEVLRTDTDDEACRAAPRKVGADADGAPGGCSAITITLQHPSAPVVEVGPTAD